MAEEDVAIGSSTTTGISAVSKAIKSASVAAAGNSTISTGVEKRVNHCEDNERESGVCVGVWPDRMECVVFLGRERRRLGSSGLEENSSSRRAVTRLNALESECTPCTIPSRKPGVRTYRTENG